MELQNIVGYQKYWSCKRQSCVIRMYHCLMQIAKKFHWMLLSETEKSPLSGSVIIDISTWQTADGPSVQSSTWTTDDTIERYYNHDRNLTNEHKTGDHKSDTNGQSLQKVDSLPTMKKNLSHKSIRAHFDLEYNDELPPAYTTEVFL